MPVFKKKHKFIYKRHPKHKKHRMQRILAWLGLTAFLTLAVYLVEQNVSNFQASIIPAVQAPAFDGTVYPVQKVPDWVSLSSNEWNAAYNELSGGKLIDIPRYNANDLKKSTESLTWGNSAHDAIRNAKITYSVPYMGSYKLDGRENTGSHLAVDIKTAKGTPVYSIANGVVVKVSNQSSGFGKHVVIEHKNVPSIDSDSKKATYYSSYSHLDSIKVSEGSIAKKGDMIGKVGQTGTATTPHLHFQIDKSTAPWHPYWAFSWKDQSEAGLSFTEAVDAGLGKEDALKNTIHPMEYVQKYLKGSVSSSNSNTANRVTNDDENADLSDKPDLSDKTDLSDTPLSNDEPESFTSFKIIMDESYLPGEEIEATIMAVDDNGHLKTEFTLSSSIQIEVTEGTATIKPRRLQASDFTNGKAEITITPRNENPLKFRIKTDKVMVDSPTIAPGIFLDISNTHPNLEAINFLKNEGVIQGYPDGTFKPDNIVSRTEVLKFILEGIEADVKTAKKLTFKDTKNSEWYADYVYTGQQLGIIEGYPDNTFKPSQSVNKVEFLKMLFESMGIDLNPDVDSLPFTDVDEKQWYAKYIKFALDKNIIESEGGRFNPTEKMKREDVAEAIYRVKVLTLTGASTFTANLADNLS